MCRECNQDLDAINEMKRFTRAFLIRRDLYLIAEGEVSIRVLVKCGKIYSVFGEGKSPDDSVQFPEFFSFESAKNLMFRLAM